MSAARSYQITGIDTSPGYGYAEELIGSSKITGNTVYSKIDDTTWNAGLDATRRAILKTSSDIGQNQLVGIMFHSASTLLQGGSKAADDLTKLADQGLFEKWGVSAYSPEEIEKVLCIGSPDFVQIPANIADHRFANSGVLDLLKTQGIEVHVRSVFLQGFLLQESAELSGYFQKWSPWLAAAESLARDFGVSKMQLAVLPVLLDDRFDKIVVGIDSAAHLTDLYNQIQSPGDCPGLSDVQQSLDLDLIDPRRWEL